MKQMEGQVQATATHQSTRVRIKGWVTRRKRRRVPAVCCGVDGACRGPKQKRMTGQYGTRIQGVCLVKGYKEAGSRNHSQSFSFVNTPSWSPLGLRTIFNFAPTDRKSRIWHHNGHCGARVLPHGGKSITGRKLHI